jgi:exopolyphosphatase/guanosine-5'-triphosphate,3'-diphosphate pyrophosphatase
VSATVIAVVDLGSNSGRVSVFRPTPLGHLEILADARAPLRLAHDINEYGRIGEEALARIVEAVRDFLAVARGAGATRTVGVATSAIREADNGAEVVARIEAQAGLRVDVVEGDREAAYAFHGAVHGLAVEAGLLFDVGGGSMEISRFTARGMVRAWTLPLGSLRLSDRFVTTDPPSDEETSTLRKFVWETLEEARLPDLGPDERLVGTGGTVRNLARVDERRHRHFIPHLHGYSLPADRLAQVTALLLARRAAKRRSTPGLNADRVDSIVGGAVAVEGLVDHVGASDVLVSAQGLREGAALATLGYGVMEPAEVRRASLSALVERFTTWDERRASRRAEIAERLQARLAPADDKDALVQAATVLDIGRALDYYDRFEEAATVLLGADVAGYTHHHLALVAAILMEAAGNGPGKSFRAVLSKRDRDWTRAAGVILALAEEVDRRTPPGDRADVTCQMGSKEAIIEAPALAAWQPRIWEERFRRAFRRRLVIGREK